MSVRAHKCTTSVFSKWYFLADRTNGRAYATMLRSSVVVCHRLRGSASPVLTATHHSYGSPKLSDFFPAHLWRSDRPTDFDAKWLKRRAFTYGCAFCNKNRNFSYPLISRAPKRSKFRKFFDFENFSLDLAFNIRGP